MPHRRHVPIAIALLQALLLTLPCPAEPETAKRADAAVETYVAAGGDEKAKRAAVEELRLLGPAGMEAIRKALDANDKARGTNEAERRNVLICEAWTRTEMVPGEKGADWKAIRPELCLGGKPVVPPEGTKVVRAPLAARPDSEGEEELEEEYCVREGGDPVRHGPCVVRNASGLAVEQGQYREGRKDGEWTSASCNQVVVRTWKDGVPVADSARVLGEPRWIVLDFSKVRRTAFRISVKFGSTWVAVEEGDKDEVVLRVGGEIEMGSQPETVYRVPRSVGRRTFDVGSMGLDLSSLEEYRQKK